MEEEVVQYKVEQAELSVRGAISETKKALSEARKELKQLLRSTNFDYSEYSDLEENVISLEMGLKKAETFLKEKF